MATTYPGNATDRLQAVARHLSQLSVTARAAIPRRAPGLHAPLSRAQEEVWLDAQGAPGLPLYNEPVTIHHSGPLDEAVLRRALNEILRRHEAWRSGFTAVSGQAVQWVEPELEAPWAVSDLRRLPEAEREAEALRLATADARRPLDLGQPPLFRARLVLLSEIAQRLYLTLSHLIFDGIALYQVFLPELAALYSAFAEGRSSPLPASPWQLGDYACWERGTLAEADIAPHLAYWRRQLGGELPELELPTDYSPLPAATWRGAMHTFRLPAGLVEAARRMARRGGATMFQLLLASFAAILHRYSRQEDLLIGSVTGGRGQPGANQALGYFLRPIVLRLDLGGDPPFHALLARVQKVVWEAMEHDCVLVSELVRELHPRRQRGRNGLFRAMFTLEPPLPPLPPGWELTQMDVDTGTTKYDLYLETDDRGGEILARFHYSTDLFAPATVRQLAVHWQRLLAAALESPDAPITALPILRGEERDRILVDWNRTARPLPPDSLPALIARQAAASPRRVAVTSGGNRLSYAALQARSCRLARYLRGLGAGRESLVAIGLERSTQMVVGLLAILQAGAAYLPLDPGLPRERVQSMLRTARPSLLLTESKIDALWPEEAPRRILLDRDAGAIARESRQPLEAPPAPEDLAYVLFTSGSSGEPKGVQIEHRGLANLLRAMLREPGMSARDTLVAVTALTFDIAGLEMYLPLLAGGHLVIASERERHDGARLAQLLRRSRATLMQATPATWRLLLESGWRGGPRFKVLCGGEALPADLARALSARAGEVWNLYGPTETTIWSAAHKFDPAGAAPVPIGRPIANTELYVLDERREPVPLGAAGELYIGGAGVARGYLRRPELTAERFVPHPFAAASGARVYRTGDRCRWRRDGCLEWLGRLDQQVKLSGFRIELGEIEAALERHPAVLAAAAVVEAGGGGERFLAAYFVARSSGQTPRSGELRAHLRRTLPPYMLPARFQALSALPLSPSGKLDRRALAAMPGAMERPRTAPRDSCEHRLAALFRALLGATEIGVEDDFFDLGGYSALALRLMDQIEAEFKVCLPVAALFQAPTVAALARLIRGEEAAPGASPLVALQAGGGRPPLICIHPADGHVMIYRQLARHLGANQPVYALQAQGLEGRLAPLTRVQDMAAMYVRALRQAQVHGPYYLGGYCGGGTIAFEVAQQLFAAGDTVAVLALFETSNWRLLGPLRGREKLAHAAERVAFHLSNTRRLDREGRRRFLREKWGSLRSRLPVYGGSLLERLGWGSARARALARVWRANDAAVADYVAGPYPGPIVEFRPEREYSHLARPELALGLLARGGSRLVRLPVAPAAMMREPFVRDLAAELRRVFAIGQGPGSPPNASLND